MTVMESLTCVRPCRAGHAEGWKHKRLAGHVGSGRQMSGESRQRLRNMMATLGNTGAPSCGQQ